MKRDPFRAAYGAAVITACVLVLAAVSLTRGRAEPSPAQSPPAWAYPVNPPGFKYPADDHVPRHVPGSSRTFLPAQLQSFFNAPDWHPNDHPPMPYVVARGRRPHVFACGFCHRPNGAGGPENASLAGLPFGYIVQQMADFKNGKRRTSVPKRSPPRSMVALSRSISGAETVAAARYFSNLRPKSYIRVVETATVPATRVAGWFLAIDPTGRSEPIGERIIEVPANLEQFENRDDRALFIAYVPAGSVRSGKALVLGSGATTACATCHGARLNGAGAVPSIAGRSPSYIVRQLFDIQSGRRTGAGVEPMKAVVRHLTASDMVAIAAYLATLKP